MVDADINDNLGQGKNFCITIKKLIFIIGAMNKGIKEGKGTFNELFKEALDVVGYDEQKNDIGINFS